LVDFYYPQRSNRRFQAMPRVVAAAINVTLSVPALVP